MKTLKKLAHYFKPYIGSVILYCILGFLIIGIGMIIPQFQRILIDYVFSGKTLTLGTLTFQGVVLVGALCICMLSQSVVRQIIFYFRQVLHEKIAIYAVGTMRSELFDRLLFQSQSFLHKQSTGNIMTVLNSDPEVVKNFFIGTLPQMMEVIIGFIFGAIMMITIHPITLLSAFLTAPIAVVFSRRAGRRIQPLVLEVRDRGAELSRRAQENLNGIRVVKAFNNEQLECQVFDTYNKSVLEGHFAYLKEYVRSYLPLTLLSSMPYIIINILSAALILNEQMTVGELLAIGGYFGYVTQLFGNIPNWINAFQNANTSGGKMNDFLYCGSGLEDKPESVKLEAPHGDISINNITMSFDGVTVLNDVSIELPRGKHLGIMGKTGAGKSVLLDMLMRYYDPVEGTVTVDGIDARDIKLEDYRRLFSPVFQDVFLFSETITKNISFGCSSATAEDIAAAAKIAQVDDFIETLPEKYETIIGERGMGLSGGQRQRVSIARAVLKKSPIMLFDDASSALDMETEKALRKALHDNLRDTTVITVAHRAASVMDCDEIIYLENGAVTERGTHEQLMALKGRYYTVYSEQMGTGEAK